MIPDIFDFKVDPLSTIEIAYFPDCTVSCYYVQLTRKNYPCNIYAKITTDNFISEIYPIYLNSAKNSIDVIKNRIGYLCRFDWKHYAYLSWDMINIPNEIYIPKKNCIQKYVDDTLDATYYTISIDKIKDNKVLSNKIKDFTLIKSPDVFMYVIKNNELKRFCLIYNFMNPNYIHEKIQVPGFKPDTFVKIRH